MSGDLIRRQDAIDAIHKEFDEVCVWDESGQTIANEVENILYEVPSAKPERMAKVSNQIFNNSNSYTVGVWIGTCECGELVSYSSKYCHICGARLEWE